jgi:hypothetical protein
MQHCTAHLLVVSDFRYLQISASYSPNDNNFNASCWVVKISKIGGNHKMCRLKLHSVYTKHYILWWIFMDIIEGRVGYKPGLNRPVPAFLGTAIVEMVWNRTIASTSTGNAPNQNTHFKQCTNQCHPSLWNSYPLLQLPFPGALQFNHPAVFLLYISSHWRTGVTHGNPSIWLSLKAYDFHQGGYSGPQMFPLSNS